MKTIATFWKTEEAHLLRLRLGEAGIPAFLQDEHITQLYPWSAAAIGGSRVQVADADFEEAQRILSECETQPAGGQNHRLGAERTDRAQKLRGLPPGGPPDGQTGCR